MSPLPESQQSHRQQGQGAVGSDHLTQSLSYQVISLSGPLYGDKFWKECFSAQ